eukprot:scaffold26331_cov19-Tisochrysis_lutea.AAC.1
MHARYRWICASAASGPNLHDHVHLYDPASRQACVCVFEQGACLGVLQAFMLARIRMQSMAHAWACVQAFINSSMCREAVGTHGNVGLAHGDMDLARWWVTGQLACVLSLTYDAC